ncbi:MAG: FkbM family methyltransferase [Gammaproteobacteria bacterium]|nr:FkbM family methyltransferase [Gammaproteobacteria bacterium]
MQLIGIFKRIWLDFSAIPREVKQMPGNKYGNSVKLFLDKCVRTIGYLWHITFRNRKYDNKLERLGNYRIVADSLNSDSIVYSCGVAENIQFDEAVAAKYGCKVHMFDPTDKSRLYMKSVTNPNLDFHNIGIWSENGDIKFYHPNDPGSQNLSATNIFHSDTYVSIPCKTIATLMSEFGHASVDVLKMDIEGAAFEVLNGILDSKVYPKQIVVELERPFFIFGAGLGEIVGYLITRFTLRKRLIKLGYELVELKANELLAVKK